MAISESVSPLNSAIVTVEMAATVNGRQGRQWRLGAPLAIDLLSKMAIPLSIVDIFGRHFRKWRSLQNFPEK